MNKRHGEQAGRVRIFDTTLRDGEQSPGATLTSHEKIEVARALSRLGVDAMEAGFPAASLDDLAAVKLIAEEVGNHVPERRPSQEPPIICALARATKPDIDKAWEAVKPAKHPRIHTFLATSPIHMEHKLRLKPEQVLEKVRTMVAYAATLCRDVEFSPEDAGRSEPEFLYQVLKLAIEAGATTLNIPDTVGYALPDEFGKLIGGILANVPGADKVIVSVHCHNDLGLATANTLAGLRAGARQAEVTINGIGERAGNTALEEVVMALKTRSASIALTHGIDTQQIARVSRLVSNRTGILIQPNKAVVGANAFAHESGIHQDGMIKHQETYEIMRPEDVGVSATRLVLGKHSGRNGLGVRLRELGYNLDGEQMERAFERFKALCDKKKEITTADLEALVEDEIGKAPELFTLEGLQVGCGTQGMPTATVRLKGPDGQVHTQAAVGTGPVHAIYKAIGELVVAPHRLEEFTVNSITAGIDALGEVSVRVVGLDGDEVENPQHGHNKRVFQGHGADTDILVASAKAYLAAMNKLLTSQQAHASAAPAHSYDAPAAAAAAPR
jgi:2-isopropylmalate synthase